MFYNERIAGVGRKEKEAAVLRQALSPLEEWFFGSTPERFGIDIEGLLKKLNKRDPHAADELLMPIMLQENGWKDMPEETRLLLLEQVRSIREKERQERSLALPTSLLFLSIDQVCERLISRGLSGWVQPSHVMDNGQIKPLFEIRIFDQAKNPQPIDVVFPGGIELEMESPLYDFLKVNIPEQKPGEPPVDHFKLEFSLPAQSEKS